MMGTTLRIFYIMDEHGLQDQLEKELIKVLEKYEYQYNPVSHDLLTPEETKPGGIRDLRFDKKLEIAPGMAVDPGKAARKLYPKHEGGGPVPKNSLFPKETKPEGENEVEGGEDGP